MQIKVPRNELFDQMPRSVRRAMIGEDIPEYFTFEVSKFIIGSFPDEESIRSEFGKLKEICTVTEWYMFCLLVTAEQEVSYDILGSAINSIAKNPTNIVNIHIKNLRKKAKESDSRIRIDTVRGGRMRSGAYKLKRI